MIAPNEPERGGVRLSESLGHCPRRQPISRITILRHLGETLAIALAGGAALGLAGVPAGWLSGSILAVAGASLAGRPMLIPTLMMRAIFVLIGISLGAVVTPETLHGMATYPLSIAVLLVAMAFISIGGAGYLRLVHRWGKVDAYLAAAPGGMSQVLALGAELGARSARNCNRAKHSRGCHCRWPAGRIVAARPGWTCVAARGRSAQSGYAR